MLEFALNILSSFVGFFVALVLVSGVQSLWDRWQRKRRGW